MKNFIKIFGLSLAIMFCGTATFTQAEFNIGTYASGYNVIGTENSSSQSGDARLIDTVKTAVNRVLGILSLIALILCLRGGFQMLTAAGDEGKVKKGTKVLTHAAIGLAVIGLSWIFVTFIFYLINNSASTTA